MQQGKIVPGEQLVLARVGIGVAVRAGAAKPDISSVEAFKRALLAAKSIVYTDPAVGGASGIHFEKVSIAWASRKRSKPIDPERPGRDHAQRRNRGTRRSRARHPTDQRNRIRPRRRAARAPAGELQAMTVIFGGNCHDRSGAGRRQGVVQFPDLACRRSGHQGGRHGTGRLGEGLRLTLRRRKVLHTTTALAQTNIKVRLAIWTARHLRGAVPVHTALGLSELLHLLSLSATYVEARRNRLRRASVLASGGVARRLVQTFGCSLVRSLDRSLGLVLVLASSSSSSPSSGITRILYAPGLFHAR